MPIGLPATRCATSAAASLLFAEGSMGRAERGPRARAVTSNLFCRCTVILRVVGGGACAIFSCYNRCINSGRKRLQQRRRCSVDTTVQRRLRRKKLSATICSHSAQTWSECQARVGGWGAWKRDFVPLPACSLRTAASVNGALLLDGTKCERGRSNFNISAIAGIVGGLARVRRACGGVKNGKFSRYPPARSEQRPV